MNAVTTPTRELVVDFEPTPLRPLALRVSRDPDGFVWAGLAVKEPAYRVVMHVGVPDLKAFVHQVFGEWRLAIGNASIDITQTEAARLRDELQLPERMQP